MRDLLGHLTMNRAVPAARLAPPKPPPPPQPARIGAAQTARRASRRVTFVIASLLLENDSDSAGTRLLPRKARRRRRLAGVHAVPVVDTEHVVQRCELAVVERHETEELQMGAYSRLQLT